LRRRARMPSVFGVSPGESSGPYWVSAKAADADSRLVPGGVKEMDHTWVGGIGEGNRHVRGGRCRG
jgi:hypothetical protein